MTVLIVKKIVDINLEDCSSLFNNIIIRRKRYCAVLYITISWVKMRFKVLV